MRDIWKEIIDGRYLLDMVFIKTIMSAPLKDNEYVTIDKDGYILHLITNHKIKRTKGEPIFVGTQPIKIEKGFMQCVKEDMDTTIGRLLLNYLYIEYGLESMFDYINSQFDFEDIENKLIPLINEGKTDILTYKKVSKVVVYLRPLAMYVTIPSTEKTDFKPEWLEKYKKEVKDKYIKKYGEDALKDSKIYLAYETEVMDKYKDYLKDDPTYGITTDGKIVNQSLKKRFVAMGLLDTLDPNVDFGIIEESLKDGIPMDKDKFATIINNIYNGSAQRGISTKDSGYLEKIFVKMLLPYVIDVDDCFTSKTYPYQVTEKNKGVMLGKYYMIGTKTIRITKDNIDTLVGKIINLRLPHLCKAGPSKFCRKCSGESLSKTENGMLLVAIGLGGEYLNFNLSKFHATTYKLIKVNVDDLF